ncbi:MAG: DUF5715 family protein [Paludibacteraceae bacterium]|nr:DUF5715 family protein [Paludibacteraceae bacterium]
MPKDIFEKILVTLWVILIISLIAIVHCYHPSSPSSSNEETCLTPVVISNSVAEPLKKEVSEDSTTTTSCRHLVSYNGRYFRYSTKFRDKNDLHLNAAQSIGLSHGPENRADARKMTHQLTEIKTNNYYVVEELTHSVPYLVPTAANRLDSIGKEFADILQRNGLPHYRFRVTSILRTQEDIRRLQRCNHNAIPNSPHNYGTTFDLGYWHYDKVTQTNDSMTDDNLKLVLAQTLLNQQRAGHIYVKYEYKQSCFHVTARN